MPEFHNTGYGKKFFEHQLPTLIKNLGRIADALEAQNATKEGPAKKEPKPVLKNKTYQVTATQLVGSYELDPEDAEELEVDYEPGDVVCTKTYKVPNKETALDKFLIDAPFSVLEHFHIEVKEIKE